MVSLESELEPSLAMRIHAWRGVLKMIEANPVTGTGLGTFASAYPLFKIYGETSIWDQAHNDYLQVAAESGLIGLALFSRGLLSLWRRGIRPRLSEGWRLQSPVALGAVVGLVVLLFHSLVDFNLQIPSNGLLFVLLAGLVLAELPMDRPEGNRLRRKGGLPQGRVRGSP